MSEFFDFTWNYIIVFLFVLTVLVFVHEYGHFWVARRNGVRVEAFSVGFGPEVFGWHDKHSTRWKVCLIPLGGYVKMFGEGAVIDSEDESRPLTDEEKAVSFHYKTVGQRAAIVFAGPAVNFLFAVIVLAALSGIVGLPKPLAGVGAVIEGSVAEKAGFETGDTIVAINNQDIRLFEQLKDIVSVNPNVSLSFSVIRKNENINIIAIPGLDEVVDESGDTIAIGLIGIRPDPEQIEYQRQNPVMAVWTGVTQTATMTMNILSYVGELIVGDKGTEELGGPLRIAQISGEMAQSGFVNVIFLMAILSINLGVINLLPVPMLDGGHLAFYAIEAAIGKPVNPKVQEYSFRFGLVLVLLLIVFVTWNDLVHLRVVEFIKELVT